MKMLKKLFQLSTVKKLTDAKFAFLKLNHKSHALVAAAVVAVASVAVAVAAAVVVTKIYGS